jgi:hypothetical protein
MEALQTKLEVFHPASQVFLGIEGIFHPQQRRGFRHKLHEAHGPLGGDGLRITSGFLAEDSPDQLLCHAVAPGVFFNQTVEVGPGQG